jgi:micrococcal nuclease
MTRGREASQMSRRGWWALTALTLLVALAALVWFTRQRQDKAAPSGGCAVTSVVHGVSDGDTVRFDCDGAEKSGRLAGIDAPEKRQPFGPEAREALKALIAEGPVFVETVGSDRYGRAIVTLTPTAGGPTLNARMVAAGFAWHYTRYSDDAALAAAEAAARASGLGLWRDAAPEAPWAYRKARRDKGAAVP